MQILDEQTGPSYWNDTRQGLRTVELRAAGFDPADAAKRNAIVTVACPIGIVRDGDTIVIDPGARILDLAVDASEIARRLATREGSAGESRRAPRGSVLDKSARLVSSAHYGCVL